VRAVASRNRFSHRYGLELAELVLAATAGRAGDKAARFVEALEQGDAFAHRRGLDLAEDVLEATAQRADVDAQRDQEAG
jgi:hypothetical protein